MNEKLPIHFVWFGPPMPDWAAANIRRAQSVHPDREICVHGEEILWEPWRRFYERATRTALKGDLLKLSAARRFGGWVSDVDVWFLRPLDCYEVVRPPEPGTWFGGLDAFLFGVMPDFDWDLLDTALRWTYRPHEHNVCFWMIARLATWSRRARFDVLPSGQLCIPLHTRPAMYARLVNGLATDIGQALAIHGHKNIAPIPDSAVV